MWGLVCHGLFSVAVIGGFYIYILVDIFLQSGDSKGTIRAEINHGDNFRSGSYVKSQNGIHDTGRYLLMSLPILLLFVMGCFSFYLAMKVEAELEARKADQERLEILDQEEAKEDLQRMQIEAHFAQ